MRGIVAAHREYLALGGRGFLLGDGGLNYGHKKSLKRFTPQIYGEVSSRRLTSSTSRISVISKDRAETTVRSREGRVFRDAAIRAF
jgi:hypothetical protein